MRQLMLRAAVLWAVASCFVLSAGAEEPTSPEPSAVAAEKTAPVYTVKVTRSGHFLNARIVTESREQADLLFGKEWRRSPIIHIYKDDVLLDSGSFAFG